MSDESTDTEDDPVTFTVIRTSDAKRKKVNTIQSLDTVCILFGSLSFERHSKFLPSLAHTHTHAHMFVCMYVCLFVSWISYILFLQISIPLSKNLGELKQMLANCFGQTTATAADNNEDHEDYSSISTSTSTTSSSIDRQRIFYLGRELKSGGRSLRKLGLGTRFHNRILHWHTTTTTTTLTTMAAFAKPPPPPPPGTKNSHKRRQPPRQRAAANSSNDIKNHNNNNNNNNNNAIIDLLEDSDDEIEVLGTTTTTTSTTGDNKRPRVS